jgi:hypothetical protein
MSARERATRRDGTSSTSPAADRTAVASPAARRWRWAIAGGLALLCAAAYSNAFTTGFPLDNRQLILRDPRVHAATTGNLALIVQHTYWWPYGESGLYRPLTTFTYLLNYALLGNGERPAGYHWVNLLLHIANVLLVWRVTRRVTRDEWTSAAAAALWAVVPLSTEAVTNIVGRADLLAATGSLGAVLLYLHAREIDGTAHRLALLAAAAAALTAGALAKESAVATLAVLVLIELLWWTHRSRVRRLAEAAVVFALPLGAWALQRASVLEAGGTAEFPFTDNPIVGAGFWQARLTAVQVMWRYIARLAWPVHLSADYSYPQIPLASGTAVDWIACLLLVGGTAAALWQVRTNRAVLFFAGFALLTFLPVSNLLFASGTIMGERLVYLPSAGLAALVAIAITRLATTRAGWRAATAFTLLLVGLYGARTYARNPDWTSDITLWRATVAASPASAKAHRALAEALYDSDPSHANIDEVIAEADRSVALLDPLPDEQNTFQAFRQAGAYYLDKANRIAPDAAADAELRRLYARALSLLDRAVVIARAGAGAIGGRASLAPEADAQRLRAAALLGLRNPALALTAARRARQLAPADPLAYHLSAAALVELQRAEEAAMTLLAGSIVSGDRSLGQEAMTLYANGLDTEGCAVSGNGTTAVLNPRCPIVQRHSCIASAAAYQILQKGGQTARAEETRAKAVSALGCPADLMDRTNDLVP